MSEQRLGEATCGVWTARDALAAGLSRHDIAGRLRRGEWQRLHRGVFSTGGTIPHRAQCAWAAVLACGPGSPAAARGAVAAGRTAARLHGLPLLDDDGTDDVIGTGRSRPALRVHRWQLDESVRVSGCPVTSVDQTLRDLARVTTRNAVVCAADHALHRGLVAPEGLAPWLARLADGRAESPLETLTRLLLLPVLPGLVPQLEVTDAGFSARLDLGDPARRLGVEADGRTWHGSWEAGLRDRQREERLRRLGWIVVRVTWDDVRSRPEQTIARVSTSDRRAVA